MRAVHEDEHVAESDPCRPRKLSARKVAEVRQKRVRANRKAEKHVEEMQLAANEEDPL